MIQKVTRQYDKDHVLALLDPLISKWFNRKFSALTPPQAYAVPLIHERRNVLIASPTGSGKTLTAFLTILNELFILGRTGRLENKIYCVYISPLKALANDIERNLNQPLKEIYELAEEEGIEIPKIRVGVRSGDTSAYEKQKMVKNAPHILITTPETLAIVLSTTKFKDNLRAVKYVIVDEIHEVCSSKRGVHLSVSLERLQYLVTSNFSPAVQSEISSDDRNNSSELTRIGLSATQAPINEIAKFLVGYNGSRLRDVNVIEALFGKQLDLKVLCPVQDMNLVPFEIVNAKMYHRLKDMIDSHRTTLVFTNTRSGAEAVVFKLQERGIERVAAHHGSLSKEVRLGVESQLKNGELDATITSTSLELGIDIGYIDLVCQIGSPKSIAKGLQRIGRAGHALHEVSKGRLIVFDRDDLVECTVLVKSAYDGNIDRISIPKNSSDVLSQTLIGMSLEQRWQEDSAFEVIKNSYCYHDIRKRDFRKVLNFISGRHTLESSGVYGKIWYDPADKSFGLRRGSRLIYNLNVGTIPQETAYHVVLFGAGMPLGSLSEKFVERLSKGDVFILGGKTYEFIQAKGMKVLVKDALGRKPTIPSWTGEMLPRSFDLSCAIGRFRGLMGTKLQSANGDSEAAMKWLADEYYIDDGSARSIVNYMMEQVTINPQMPTDRHVVIEGYIDARGQNNIIFHFCFGRRVNDALSRAYAAAISKKYQCTVKISLTDDNFMLSVPKRVRLDGIEKLIRSGELLDVLKSSIRHTELFKQRFRHCAVRSFMILRNYKGREISIRKQHYRAQRVLDVLDDSSSASGDELPVMAETFNEILHDAMDIDNAETIIKGLESGKIGVSYSQYSNIPSPLAHNIVLIGISDIVLMEDRSALLRELHKQVLAKVISKKELAESKFTLEPVEKYFANKLPKLRSKKSIVPLLRTLGPIRLFVEKGRNIFNYTGKPRRTIHKWCRELVNEGELTSIRRTDTGWIHSSELPEYYAVYGKSLRATNVEKELLKLIEAGKLPDKLDRQQRDALRRLEKHFVIYRSKVESYGVYRWALRDLKSLKKSAPPFDEALDSLIANHLEFHGVSTVAELAYELAIDEELIKKILGDMEDRSIITSGNFVLGKDIPQFMLLKDMLKLELVSARNEESEAGDSTDRKKELVMDQSDYVAFVEKQEFKQVATIDDYFDRYLVAFDSRDIFFRVKNFDLVAWHDMLAGGKVIKGRFMAGRVCYIRRQDMGPVVSFNRRVDLDAVENKVIELIRSRVEAQHASAPHEIETGSGNNGGIGANSNYETYINTNHRPLKNEGVTRSELISALNYRENDIVDIIDKLDYNLYIARSKRDVQEHSILNRYITLDIDELDEGAGEKLTTAFIAGYGPVNYMTIKNTLRLPGDDLKNMLQDLEDSGEIFKFVVVGEGPMEVYASTAIRQKLMRFNSAKYTREAEDKTASRKPSIRVLSQTDPFTRRFEYELRNKFGEDWSAAVFKDGKACGVMNLWKLASSVEVRNIIFDHDMAEADKEIVLDRVLKEMDNLMKYYSMHGIDILKVLAVESDPVSSVSVRIKAVLKKRGYNLVQDSYVKGRVLTVTFSKPEIMNYIMYQQHIHPARRFDDPMDVVRNLGGVRSIFELHLRLNGRAYDLKEFGRHYDLVSGQMIPGFLMFCTETDAQLYKIAKGQDLDNYMEHVLVHIPDGTTVKSSDLRKKVNFSDSTFKSVIKRLYEGLYIVKTPINYFKKIENVLSIDHAEARKMVVKRVFDNFGIFSAEGLSAFLKRAYSMEELRILLRELEDEGVLIKGYLVEGRPGLYWMLKGAERKIRKIPKMRERFVLTPQDQLCYYLIEDIREKFKLGSCYVIFNGSNMTGAFKASKHGGRLLVSEFTGDDEDWTAIRFFAQQHKLDLLEEGDEELYDYDD